MGFQIVIDVDDAGNSSLRPVTAPPGIVIMHLEIMKAIVLQAILNPQPEPKILTARPDVLRHLNGGPSG